MRPLSAKAERGRSQKDKKAGRSKERVREPQRESSTAKRKAQTASRVFSLLFACYPDESYSKAKPALADRRRGTNKEKGRTAQRKYLRRVNAPVFIV